MTKAHEREAINHGHNKWNGQKWVPDYKTWCPACRNAVAK